MVHRTFGTGTAYYSELLLRAIQLLGPQGIEAVPLGAFTNGGATSRLALRWPFRLCADLAVGAVAGRLDLIHYPTCVGPPVRSVPIVATLHDVSPIVFPEFHPFKRRVFLEVAWKAVVSSARIVLTDTEWQARKVLEVYPEIESKLQVLPLVCDSTFTRLEPAPPPPERPFILSVGTLEPRKNIHRLVKAWKKSGIEADLVLVGAWGWKTRETRQLLDSLGTQDAGVDCAQCWSLRDGRQIRRYEGISTAALQHLYATAQFLAYPSSFEGFGLPVLEAMTCGCPVLTSSNSAMEEVAGEAAWYVDPNDELSIAEGMLDLLGNPAERNSRVEAGLLRAGEYSLERFSQHLMKIYLRSISHDS